MVLRGPRVVITRASASADGMASSLASMGATPVRFPAIETRPPESFDALDAALRSIANRDWVIFTSATGVQAAFDRQAQLGGATDWLAGRAVVAVGPATAGALADRGIADAVVPAEFLGERIPETLGSIRGRKFLLLRGNLASDTLPDRLRSLGGIVEDIEAYRTVPLSAPVGGAAADAVRSGVDAVTFTSPSTVEGFVCGVGEDWRDVVSGAMVATIGPVTSAAARSYGMRVDVEADPHTVDELVRALIRAFEAREMEQSA
jgi:uroporphyrinogen III methyltransferase/synthase